MIWIILPLTLNCCYGLCLGKRYGQIVGHQHTCANTCLQALKETSVPEQAIYRPPADPRYCKRDDELCKLLTGAEPVRLEDGRDRLAALLDCAGDASSAPLSPGPTIQDYHSAYTSVRSFILRAAAGAASNPSPGTDLDQRTSNLYAVLISSLPASCGSRK